LSAQIVIGLPAESTGGRVTLSCDDFNHASDVYLLVLEGAGYRTTRTFLLE